jgi:acyl transferase domain-containing protein/acyl carrier protein
MPTPNSPVPTAEPIAIIGMSCRFPGGANSPGAYWRILESGTDVIGDIPPSRWDKHAFYDPDGNVPGKMYTMRGGFLDVPIDLCDTAFFNISPKEATDMDPQQRILLELSWEALEDAGINPETLRGGDAGVFIGVSSLDYALHCISDNISRVTSYSLTGNCQSALAGRISFIFGLHGPSLAIDTACSSSLVAIDNACAHLRLRKTGLALAGGFNLMLSPNMQICLTKLQALSPDGLCKSFDAQANGYARSEGGGLVVLKRLDDAVAQSDRILGVIRGSFVNQDGQSTGISAPNGKAQEKVIVSALREAGVDAAQIDYIEAHGTGTRVGDKTEITAIGNVMRRVRDHGSPVLVGSVKSNIGHLEAASGIAGLQKVVLALQHGVIPGNLHFTTPNPGIDWANLPLRVVDRNTPWERNGKPRLAGISSYGFVGTNSHLILEEPPGAGEDPAAARPFHTLPLSARTPEALERLIRRYLDFLKTADEDRLPDICHTAATGRRHFEFRAAAHGRDLSDFTDSLAEVLEGACFPRIAKDRRVVFLYTGQGSQYHGMGRQLYQTQPVFRKALDRCDRLYRELEGVSLLDMIHGEGADQDRVNHTRYAQPLIFSLGYALTRLWLSWGVKPAAVAGHSVGEYTAACLAGVFSLRDALRLVAIRGRLMGSVPGDGLMVSVSAPRQDVEAIIAGQNGRVAIAALNAPDSIVISGFADAVRPVLETLKDRRIHHQLLNVSHAFHSPQMDPVLGAFAEAVSAVALREPKIPLISNATAEAARPGELTDPRYWVRHMRAAVRMSESLAYLDKQGYAVFLEIGPKPTLLAFAKRCLANPRLVLASSLKARVPDLLALAESLGDLYRAGVDPDWNRVDAPFRARKTSIPTYPFSGQRYWVNAGARTPSPAGPDADAGAAWPPADPLIGRRMEISALPGAALFQMAINRGAHYFFEQHVILGVPTAPAAALLSWMWLAARRLFPGEPFSLAEITLTQPLILYDADRIGQIVVNGVDAPRCAFEFVSRETGDGASWITHCTGWIVKGEPAPPPSPAQSEADSLEAADDFELAGKEFYDGMESLGYTYGPLFRGIEAASGAGNEARCTFLAPPRNAQTQDYWFTPSDLDIIFQSPAVALIRNAAAGPDPDKIHIPYYIKGIAFPRPLDPGRYRIVTRSQAAQNHSQTVESSMEVRNEKMELCAVVEGFVSAAVSKQVILREERLKHFTQMTYEEDWEPRPLATAPPGGPKPRTWLLFTEPDPAAACLADLLARQATVHVIEPGSRFEELGQGRYRLDWEQPGAVAALLDRLRPDSRESLGIVHMAVRDRSRLEPAAAAAVPEDAGRSLRGLLHLTQALLPLALPCRLYAVTAGNRPATDDDDAAPMCGTGVDGFASVAQFEHPQLQVTHVDLSPFPEEAEIGRLADELLADDAEMRVSLRRDQRRVARLARVGRGQAREGREMPLPRAEYTLEISGSGILDEMKWAGIDRRPPGPREVECEVVASGLNFKDVLRALGELKNTANRIGGEAAGVITRVGSQVEGFKPGDAVVSWDTAGGGFSSHLIAEQRFVVRKPDFLSFEQAATVPISCMTAYHGLIELAGLQKGERVLIHAGSGGVGMAAVQLALSLGAQVFSTAGSPRKRAFLAQLGAHHVLNSRTLDFSGQILELTQGQGVQVVLNSLTGDFLRQSLRVLADHGRFIELGKREILTAEQVHAVNPTISYQAFDLTDVAGTSPDGRRDLLENVFRLFADGAIRPAPVKVFPVQKANQAFRFMAQAHHIGRIALSHRRALRAARLTGDTPLRQDGAYLITGGLGGLGLELAAWMAAHPVGTVVLVGRREPSGEALAKIEALRAAGANILAVSGDVADKADCARLFAQIDRLPQPLRGIVHAAGVLRDRGIAQQGWDDFKTVLAPKVQGSWNMHLATQDRLLDFFVLFSSASCTIGNRGQSNYAAANSFMNSLALYRRSQGLCANSICWGPWAQVGMAASGSRPGLKMEQLGILGIKLTEGISVMNGIIQKDLAVPTVLDMNWNLFLENVPEASAGTYFKRFMPGGSGVPASPARPGEAAQSGSPFPPLQKIRQAAPQERAPLVMDLVRKVVARVMGYDDIAMVQTDVSLTRMGLDSLMAMDFRNQLEKRLSITLPFAFLTDNSSLEDIAGHILKEITD